MSENKMKEVAKLLGVEMGVPFNVITNGRKEHINNPFKITERGLTNRLGHLSDTVLINLLIGIYEIEQPILDNVEKRYLEGVLKPFKDKVMYLEKREEFGYQCIYFRFSLPTPEYGNAESSLPYFEKDTMYKGMELNKQYILQELGLFVDGNVKKS